MNHSRRTWSSVLMLFLLGAAGTGCDSTAVTDAARTSLSSFVISIFTAAVNETISTD